MQDGDEPKYLNSAGTAIYHKSGVLYNLHRAREGARKNGRIAARATSAATSAAAINASDDPMIRFARAVDPALRAVRKDYEDNVDAIISKNAPSSKSSSS